MAVPVCCHSTTAFGRVHQNAAPAAGEVCHLRLSCRGNAPDLSVIFFDVSAVFSETSPAEATTYVQLDPSAFHPSNVRSPGRATVCSCWLRRPASRFNYRVAVLYSLAAVHLGQNVIIRASSTLRTSSEQFAHPRHYR